MKNKTEINKNACYSRMSYGIINYHRLLLCIESEANEMREQISNKLREGVIKGLSGIRNFHDDSTNFINKLLEQGVEVMTDSAVPNEELHHNQAFIEPGAAVKADGTPERMDGWKGKDSTENRPESDSLMTKLVECSDSEFERIKKMIAEAEIIRSAENK